MMSLLRLLLLRPARMAGLFLLLISVSLAASAAARVPPGSSASQPVPEYPAMLAIGDVAGKLGMVHSAEPVTNRQVLSDEAGNRIVFAPGIRGLLVNGEFLQLERPGLLIQSYAFMVPAEAMEALSRIPLKEPPPPPPAVLPRVPRTYVVVIDAGHGGKDPGAVGPTGLREKDVNLDVALKLALVLRERGVKPVLTREDDTFVPLATRAEVARDVGPDCFVSIHANAADNSWTEGFETFVMSDAMDDRTRFAQANITQANDVALLGGPGPANWRNRQGLYLAFYEQSRRNSQRLATSIQRSIGRVARGPDRGVRQENFHVLRGSPVPAALVETGFISNSHSESLLAQPWYRMELAKAIAEGILEYLSR